MKEKGSILILFFLFTTTAFSSSRFAHDHDDIFAEDAILLGFKLGPQITRYTPVRNNEIHLPIQGSTRGVWGGAVQFVYGLPRFEFDLFWNMRGGLNTSDNLHAVSLPIVAKLPIRVHDMVDLTVGPGTQVDAILLQNGRHRRVLYNALVSTGMTVDYTDFVFEFELRYNLSLVNVSPDFAGGKPRDFQILGGLLWIL